MIIFWSCCFSSALALARMGLKKGIRKRGDIFPKGPIRTDRLGSSFQQLAAFVPGRREATKAKAARAVLRPCELEAVVDAIVDGKLQPAATVTHQRMGAGQVRIDLPSFLPFFGEFARRSAVSRPYPNCRMGAKSFSGTRKLLPLVGLRCCKACILHPRSAFCSLQYD